MRRVICLFAMFLKFNVKPSQQFVLDLVWMQRRYCEMKTNLKRMIELASEQEATETLKKEWATKNGLKESRVSGHHYNFLNKKCQRTYSIYPGFDHTTYWNKDGKPFCIVTQPYHLSMASIKSMMIAAKEYDL